MKNMQRIAVAEFHRLYSTALSRAYYAGWRLILTRRGKEVAAIISIRDLRKLEEMEREQEKKRA